MNESGSVPFVKSEKENESMRRWRGERAMTWFR
jgi:hypothetical protein